MLQQTQDESVRENLRHRAEKKARSEGASRVEEHHIVGFVNATPSSSPQSKAAHEFYWQSAALARLMRVPEGFMRDASKQRIEDYAQQHNIHEITLSVAGKGLAEARQSMQSTIIRVSLIKLHFRIFIPSSAATNRIRLT